MEAAPTSEKVLMAAQMLDDLGIVQNGAVQNYDT
jgi:hypothetical protein